MNFFKFLNPKNKKDPMTDLLQKQREVTQRKRDVMREIRESLGDDRRMSNEGYYGPERRATTA